MTNAPGYPSLIFYNSLVVGYTVLTMIASV